MPSHVAIVMDGNGRWATQRGLNRTEGHKMGEAVLIDVTCGAIEIGIKHLTVYAFSTENWKRSTEEVRFLMGFNREVVRRRRENLDAMGVRMRWVGSRPRMWRSVIKEFEIAENMTLDNDVITVNYCVNYGGRTEIVEAAKDIAREAADGRSTRTGSPKRPSPGTCTGPTFRTSTCSSGPRGSSGPATSCCGRRRMPSTSSRTSCGPTTTGATCGMPARSTSTATGDSAGPRWICNERLVAVLDEILPIQEEDDGAVTVHHDDTFASLRAVTIAEGLDMVSLTQILAWDLPLDSKIRARVAQHAHNTLLGTVSLVEKSAAAKRNSKKTADVMLRYNFPAAGLTDEALRTLILMVLSTGADVRRALIA